jgi:hypothetical protein
MKKVYESPLTKFSLPGHRRPAPVLALALAMLFTLTPLVSFADGAGTSAAKTPVAQADFPDDVVGKTISLNPKSNGKLLLDVKDSSRDEGAPIVAVKKKSGTGQRFQIRRSGDSSYYVIRSAYTGRLATDVDGRVVQTGMTVSTDDAQRWTIAPRSGGYVFTNVATAKRLSVTGASVKTVGADADVTADQIFQLTWNPITLNGYCSFITGAGNVIALSKASIGDKVSIVLKRNAKKTVGRQFLLISSPGGYHAVKNSISFKGLSVKGSSTKNGAALVQSTYKGSKNQRFRLSPSGDGWYLLRSALGTYVSAASDEAGAKLVMNADRAKALKVRIERTEYSSGMPKLDAKLKKIHKDIGSGGDMMRKSFRYVVTHYRHRDHENDFSGDWITRYAWYMISKKHGHCKNFASALCVIFRSYGYDARVVTGYVPSRSRGWAEHGWVEATIKGKTYLFDADLYVQLGNRGWYKRTYKNAPLRYRVEKRW